MCLHRISRSSKSGQVQRGMSSSIRTTYRPPPDCDGTNHSQPSCLSLHVSAICRPRASRASIVNPPSGTPPLCLSGQDSARPVVDAYRLATLDQMLTGEHNGGKSNFPRRCPVSEQPKTDNPIASLGG